ncbi:hypothetical protein [Aliiglaciecola sp. M165]|uniref:hypothetical protein n=1 Tax=Aliiglaciecola sp. M165 TaxID=2593649 RepID=UPI001180A90D|nr:hypothetical protein [Aliiglaciecola sp. M165]TRY30653.1 hypothetical protein FM019_12230 [Aliiglaciecola sp. M165]
MNSKVLFYAFLIWLISGCAQVPPSSVTVSQSIGNDVLSMSQAHAAFVNAYFDELEKEINDLIDNKYAPELIADSVKEHKEWYEDSNDKDASIIYAIEEAFVNTNEKSNEQIVSETNGALLGLQYFFEIINEDVAKRRSQLLTPIREKRNQLLNAIDANYQNIIRKNATITGLLSSVVEVHEAQDKILSELGFEEGMRGKVGNSISQISNAMKDFRSKVEARSNTVTDIEKGFDELSSNLSSLIE